MEVPETMWTPYLVRISLGIGLAGPEIWDDDVGIWDLKTWSIFGSRKFSSFAGGFLIPEKKYRKNYMIKLPIQGWGCFHGVNYFRMSNWIADYELLETHNCLIANGVNYFGINYEQ